MSEKRWTKQEFIDEVDPCGYRFRIWWFFLWHKFITIRNVVTASLVESIDKLWAIKCLDQELYSRHCIKNNTPDILFSSEWRGSIDEQNARIIIRSIRKELRSKE